MNDARPLLLMISGWAMPPSAWAGAAAALEDVADLRVLRAGELLRSPVIGRLLEEHVGDRRPAYLGGWSLGGMLALAHAGSLRRIVRGVLLIAATPRFCADDRQAWGVDADVVRSMRKRLQRDPEAALTAFYERTAHPYEVDREISRRWLHDAVQDVGGLIAGLNHLLEADLRAGTGLRGVPVSLLHGRQDAIVPYAASRALAVDLMPSRLDIVADAGHDLPVRRPELLRTAFNQLVAMAG